MVFFPEDFPWKNKSLKEMLGSKFLKVKSSARVSSACKGCCCCCCTAVLRLLCHTRLAVKQQMVNGVSCAGRWVYARARLAGPLLAALFLHASHLSLSPFTSRACRAARKEPIVEPAFSNLQRKEVIPA